MTHATGRIEQPFAEMQKVMEGSRFGGVPLGVQFWLRQIPVRHPGRDGLKVANYQSLGFVGDT